MIAPPMRRRQNLLALLGALLACGGLLPLAPFVRVACASLAVAVIVVLLTMRMRAHRVRRGARPVPGVYDRIERIRAERTRRRRR